jgi:hypothetical protein
LSSGAGAFVRSAAGFAAFAGNAALVNAGAVAGTRVAARGGDVLASAGEPADAEAAASVYSHAMPKVGAKPSAVNADNANKRFMVVSWRAAELK